jgi:hypothetical protein
MKESMTMATTISQSPTTTAASSTTPDRATAAPSTKPQRIKIRLKQSGEDQLQAYQATEGITVQAVSGASIRVQPGMWVILRAGAIVDTLSATHFAQIYEPVPEVGLTIAAADQAALAQILGFGSTNSSQQLTACVRKLAQCSIGQVQVDFSPAQWEELAYRAKKRGLPIEEYVKRLVEKLTQDLWTSAF